MNDTNLSFLVPVLVGIIAAFGAYSAARYAGHSSLAITAATTDAQRDIDERQRFQAERNAFQQEVRAEINRISADNAGLRERIQRMEKELNTTRLANITLEQERDRLIRKMSDMEAEVRWLKRHVNGGDGVS